MSTEYVVGQRLWWVEGNGKGRRVTIKEIGHEWMTLSNGQDVTSDTLAVRWVDGPPTGHCYGTRKAHRKSVAREMWYRLWNDLGKTAMPDGMTIERIAQARELLGLEGAK